MVICPKCRKAFEKGTNFCPKDGAQLEKVVQYYCHGCGIEIEPNYKFCTRCGTKQYTPEPSPIFRSVGFWIRAVAFVIDNLFILIVVFLIILSIAFLAEYANIHIDDEEGMVLILCVLFIVSFAYFVFTTNRWGKTLGKKLMRLKVAMIDGDHLSWGTCVLRWLGYYLSFSLFGLGFLWIAWTPAKQGFHDKICDTKVLRIPKLKERNNRIEI